MASLYELFGDGPLSIAEAALQDVRAQLERLAASPEAAGAPPAPARARTARVGDVAVIGIYGVIAPRGGFLLSLLGGTSCTEIAQHVREALASRAKVIVLDIDSGGGAVAGVPELARQLYDARSRARIVAVANSVSASAAYWVGSQADEFVVTPSGEVGSIGVRFSHYDFSRANRKAGVKIEHVVSRHAPKKALVNPDEPLSDAARAYIQRTVDHYEAMFIGDVSRGRSVSSATVTGQFGGGLMFRASEAVERGLVDGVATLNDTLSWHLAGGGQRFHAARAQLTDADLRAMEGRLADQDLRQQLRDLSVGEDLKALERRLTAPRVTDESLRRQLRNLNVR